MRARVAMVYSQPVPNRYDLTGEARAVVSVLDAVTAVRQALLELGYDVVQVPLTLPPEQAREKLERLSVDVIFNLFEGFCGYPETEALVPEIAAELDIACTGCPAAALTLALDKVKAKALLQAAGINTPRYQYLSPQSSVLFQLDYPCIVKPGGEDASHGLSAESVVHDFTSLSKQVIAISNFYGGGALVEEFLDGREFNATILGNSECTVLPISEIAYSLPSEMPRILTFAAKWEPESLYYQGTQAMCPAPIPSHERKQITEIALATFRLLGCRGYARVDMRLDKEGHLNVIEVNPNPDISPASGAARQARAAGMTYPQFIARIIGAALEKN